jgi:hypothetical protein
LSSTVTIVLVDGTDDRQNAIVNSPIITKAGTSTTVLNHTRVKTATIPMLLHNNSLEYVPFMYLKNPLIMSYILCIN